MTESIPQDGSGFACYQDEDNDSYGLEVWGLTSRALCDSLANTIKEWMDINILPERVTH